MNKQKFSGYKVAFGTFLIMFVHLGVLGCIGVFLPHLAKDLNVDHSTLSLVVTFATGGAFFFSLFTHRVIQKLTPKLTLYIASVICAAHYVVFGFAQNAIWIYVAGVMGGAVMAFGANVTVAAILSTWFIEKRASVIGLVFGGAGFGGAVAIFLAGQLTAAVGWRNAYLIFAAAILIIGFAGNFFFVRTTEQMGEKPLGWEKAEEQAAAAAESKAEVPGVMLAEAKKTPTYLMWMVAFFLVSMLVTGFTTYAPQYWQSFSMEAVVSSNFTSIVSLIGAAFMLISGMISEKFGAKVYVSYILIGYIIGIALLVMFPNTGFFTTILTVFFVALSYPSSSAFPSTLVTVGFGTKDYTKINSTMSTMGFLSKAALPIIVMLLAKLGMKLQQFYIVLIVFAAVGLVLLIMGINNSPMQKLKKAKINVKEG